jgi:sigma-B regulation protein RsbU (phosphoserine phosphatase)
MDNVSYTEYELKLDPGDKLFVYTDGVPEATDKDSDMFGTDRMIDTLNRDPGASPEELLKTLEGDVRKFVGKAEQFDDFTMLCIEYRGKGACNG